MYRQYIDNTSTKQKTLHALLIVAIVIGVIHMLGLVYIFSILFNIKRNVISDSNLVTFGKSTKTYFNIAKFTCVILWIALLFELGYVVYSAITRQGGLSSRVEIVIYTILIALLSAQVIGMFSITRVIYTAKESTYTLTDGTSVDTYALDMSELEVDLSKYTAITSIITTLLCIYSFYNTYKYQINMEKNK